MEADQNWMDTEFLDDFLQEAKEHLEDIESTILKLEKDIADKNIVNQMFRSFHSLKGLAGFVNQTLIQNIAHDSESLLDCCRKNTVIVDEKFTTIILKSADLIKEICKNIDITNDAIFRDTCMNHVKDLKNFINTGCRANPNNSNENKEKEEKKVEPAVKKEIVIEEKKEIVIEEVQDVIKETKEIKKEEPAVIQRNQKYEEEKASVANILARIEGKKTEEPKTEEMLTVDMIINGKAKSVEEAPVVVKEKTVEKPVVIEETQYIEKAEPKKEVVVEDSTYKENKNKEVKKMQDKEALKSGKYLTFSLGTEDYGIPIQTVREIIGMMHITNIPKTPEFIKGVVNLRGKIIPIMDLRLKFGLEKKDYGERTCIIVVEIKAEAGHRNIGIVVDMVSEVLNINQSEIELSPQDDVQNDGEFITGMGKVKDKVVMLIDIEKVLSKEEFKYIKDMKGGV